VTTAEVRSRLLHSLVPFNPKFYDISEKTPDLYGPFWIYTTLIFIIAAAGSLAKYIKGASTQNFFEEFVPIAAGIVRILNNFLDLWNRIWLAYSIDYPNEVFRISDWLRFCPVHLWLFLHYFLTYCCGMFYSN
jgi:hypothetical protein